MRQPIELRIGRHELDLDAAGVRFEHDEPRRGIEARVVEIKNCRGLLRRHAVLLASDVLVEPQFQQCDLPQLRDAHRRDVFLRLAHEPLDIVRLE